MSPDIPVHPHPQTGSSSAMIQEPVPFQPQRYQPYSTPRHRITKGRYITSNDPRGYVPVYEYPLNGQWIMMDVDDGYVLWTGIWKALGNTKADIVKMLESQPDLAPQLRRVRGGYLKIQGTWMPFEVALRLARRVAWPIREDLVPLFGPTFPSTCLSPDQPGYGQVVATSGKRKSRRPVQTPVLPLHTTSCAPRPPLPYQSVEPMYALPQLPRRICAEPPNTGYSYPPQGNQRTASSPLYPSHSPYGSYHQDTLSYSHDYGDRQRNTGGSSPIRDRHTVHSRYSPYPSSSRREYVGASGAYGLSPVAHEHRPTMHPLHTRASDPNLRRTHDPHERFTLPPISALAPDLPSPRGAVTLPPLAPPSGGIYHRGLPSSDIPYLGRMRVNSAEDSEDIPRPSEAYLQQRRSSSAPPLHLGPSRYPPLGRPGDRSDDQRVEARPSWSFELSSKTPSAYEHESRLDTRRSDSFAWSSVRGGPSASPPPSASNSTHEAQSTNEHSPISPRTPYAWESSRGVAPASGRNADHHTLRPSSPRGRSESPEISVALECQEDRCPALEVARGSSGSSHSRKSSGHLSNGTETASPPRMPLRPW